MDLRSRMVALFKVLLPLAALAILSIVIALVLWSELAGRSDEAADAKPVEIPKLPKLTRNDSPTNISSPEGITDLIEMGAQGVWTNADPELGLMQIRWDALDPKPNGLFVIEKPHATITLKDRRIVITADAGSLLWPARGLNQDREPESGTLTGNVTVSLFDGATPAEGPDAKAIPSLKFSTGSLNFDTTLGEIKTADDIRIDSERILFTGSGFTLRFSEAPWRLTHLRIASDSTAIIRAGSTASQTDRNESTKSVRTNREDAKQIDLYRLTLREDVRLRSQIAQLEAEEFVVLARMLDGSLPDGAIAEFRSTLESRSDVPRTGNVPSSDALASNEDIRMTWAGPLEIRPLRDEPAELANDDLYLKIRSPASNRVQLTDMSSGGTLRCVAIEYGATARTLAVFGIGGIGVQAKLPGSGEALFGRLDLNLTTGEGFIPGPIRITSGNRAARSPRRDAAVPLELTALDGASFRFNTAFGPVGAGGIADLMEIVFNNRVEATDGVRTVSGDAARAIFTRRTAEKPRTPPALARILVEGDARAEDERTDDFIEAQTLEIGRASCRERV